MAFESSLGHGICAPQQYEGNGESMSAPEQEYDDRMLTMLQLIWGEGFLSPGGPQAVRDIVAGIPLDGRRVLDIGCGVGGLDQVLAGLGDCHVTGIDVAQPLVALAQARIRAAGQDRRIEFRAYEPGLLPFADGSFDLVFGKDSWLHVEQKDFFFAEIFRVLKPGGHLAAGDWMKSAGAYSPDMLYYFLVTLPEYEKILRHAGFIDIRTQDITERSCIEGRSEYERLKGPLFDTMTAQLGADSRNHFIEDWRSLTVVLDKGELRPARFWARKPGSQIIPDHNR
jgi:phosphoethanolamine N-methyltransferase